MKELLKKLNFKGHRRIVIINAEDDFLKTFSDNLEGVITDKVVDQRCPYEFMLIFVKKVKEVENIAPVALHNLTADGILWFCYPKKSSKNFTPGLDRDHGWEALNRSGFYGVRLISVNEEWSAMRFRNIKFIKSTSGRFETR
jgi:hypothetical protein